MADFSCSISPGQEIDSIKKWNSILFYRMCAQNADVYDVCCYCSDLFCFVLFDFLISNNNTTLQTFSKLGRGSATQQYYSFFVSATTQSNRLQHARTLVTHCRLVLVPVYLFSLYRFALIEHVTSNTRFSPPFVQYI